MIGTPGANAGCSIGQQLGTSVAPARVLQPLRGAQPRRFDQWMGGWKAHDRIIQRLIRLLREKNIANGQRRRQKQDVSINPPAAQPLEERVAKVVGVQRGAGPVELVPVEGDGLVQDLTGARQMTPGGKPEIAVSENSST